MDKQRMLIVDDIELNREMLKNYFSKMFDIFEAANGQEGMTVLYKHQIDIVITDIFMPKMDGYEFIGQIRKNNVLKDIIVIAITDRGEEKEIRALEAGADDFINKPFRPELLNHRIRAALSKNVVETRMNQYRFCFNQNNIAFATVSIVKNKHSDKGICFQYVNDTFAEMMNSSSDRIINAGVISDRPDFTDFLAEVIADGVTRNKVFYDKNSDRYFNINAYKETDEFCSFIVTINEYEKLHKFEEDKYVRTINEIMTVNPRTLGALHMNLTKNICDRGVGPSEFISSLTYPEKADYVLKKLYNYACDNEAASKMRKLFRCEYLIEQYQKGNDTMESEILCRMINGNVKWLAANFKLTVNPNTDDIECVMYCSDINDKKMMQEVVDVIIQQGYDTLFCVDMINDTARVLSGEKNAFWKGPFTIKELENKIWDYLRECYIGDDLDSFIAKNSFDLIAARMMNKEVYNIEYRLRDENGKIRLRKGAFYWLDSSKHTLCFLNSDITDSFIKEQERNQNLEKALKIAKVAEQAKTNFLSRMSHEIRTPLNAIIGFSELQQAERRDRKTGEASSDYSDKILDASHYLLSLLNDILDMSKIESGQIQLNNRPFSPEKIINSINMYIEPMAAGKQINYKYIKNGKFPTGCIMDDIRTKQILLNLLNNAVKFTEPGGDVTFTVECMGNIEEKAAFRFVIEDSGIGIAEEFIPKLFTPFVQQHDGTTSVYGGSGLGLAIARKLALMMDGDIFVSSKVGEGTTFTVLLKFEITSDISIKEYTKNTEDVLYDFTGKNVLLCEDHPMNVLVARKLLENKGLNVVCASNGEDAVKIFESSVTDYFDIILMDIRMPVMDGLTATRKIRALDREDASFVPIVAMTANAYDEDIKRSIDSGMNAHLAKPIDPELLYKTIQRFMK